MKTTIYLVPHETGAGIFVQPLFVPGPADEPALTKMGIRQAEQTRDFLAVRPIDHCYCSPMPRAVQTAAIIAAPHGLTPLALVSLIDNVCGESFKDMQARALAALEELFAHHEREALLVVTHHDVGRSYLAGALGMHPEQAGQVQLDNCGISVVIRAGTVTTVSMVNAAFHLQGIAA